MTIKLHSEGARERETYRYAASQLAGILYQTHESLLDSSKLHTSHATVLTGLAELVVLRLNAARAIISLFDQRWQYIIAEATPRLTLAPGVGLSDDNQLLLCGTAVPRSLAICDHVISRNFEGAQVQGDEVLPVSVITDISSRLVDNPYFKSWPHRFYAGIPIRTPRGIDIGVLSIYGNDPRGELDAESVSLMQDVSRTIMDYLGAIRSRDTHRRADRMIRGVGTFVEGNATLSGWQGGTNTESFQDNAAMPEGNLNARQQGLQRQRTASIDGLQLASSAQATDSSITQQEDTDSPDLPDVEEETETTAAKHTFSKAANILRESVEVEGTLFLDASISSFGGSISRTDRGQRSSSSSSDDSPTTAPGSQKSRSLCRILGFSNSSQSSIDGSRFSHGHSALPERLLNKLIKRHPQGRIFNFDEHGSPSSGDSSCEDTTGRSALPPHQTQHPPEPQEPLNTPQKIRSLSRQNMAQLIIELFPGARSVAFVPIWDSHRQRWFAGGFIYTRIPSRVFTPEGELSYFSAFSSIVMAEIHRTQESIINKTKTDLLGSLSHELRSPLHGVVLGAELLQDTELEVFQRDVLNSLENCSRTLMGTLDHLLDWTKINKFKQESSERRSVSGIPSSGPSNSSRSIETGMMSRTSDVDIGAISEQVVESIFAGHSFQTMAVMRMVEDRQSKDAEVDSMRTLDSMQAIESMATYSGKSGNVQIALGGVIVLLSIDAELSWMFVTQPGAIRRIIMNLVGNALKFTKQGFVRVQLQQEMTPKMRPGMRLVTLSVSDSGRGISQEFLRYQLYKPFAQEDSLVTGAGLGLSLVKKIVGALGGTIKAESMVGKGSTMTVKLPLRQAVSPSPDSMVLQFEGQEEFQAHISELQGLRVAILGYPSSDDQSLKDITRTALLSEYSSLVDVCTNWLRMRVVQPHEAAELLPDLLLCGDRFLDQFLREGRNDSSTPTVVICRSALTARQLATAPKYMLKSGIGTMEFISQPLGPRKLAKVLLHCFKRWTKLQEETMSTQMPSDHTRTESMVSPNGERDNDLADQMFSQSLDDAVATSTTEPLNSTVSAELDSTEESTTPSENSSTPRQELHEGQKSPEILPPELSKKPNRVAHYLLVDDNAINLRILTAYMRKLGHAYDTASDGLEAFETFQKGNGQYKHVFMDISMPIMNGFESTRHIRAFEREKKLPKCQIYALTGLASAGAQQEAFSSGIDLFLAKPVKLTELSRILAQEKSSQTDVSEVPS